MKGNTKVIDLLNKQLTLELTSMDQYLAHSKIYEDWGINKLHEKLSHEYEEVKPIPFLVSPLWSGIM